MSLHTKFGFISVVLDKTLLKSIEYWDYRELQFDDFVLLIIKVIGEKEIKFLIKVNALFKDYKQAK